jgi:hypothetical protein
MLTRSDRNDERNGMFGLIPPVLGSRLLLRPTILILRTLRAIDIVRVHLLVLLLLLLRQILPIRPLLRSKTLPLLADRLGEIGLTLLLQRAVGHVGRFLRCLLPILTTLPSEEDERIFGTLDVVLVSLLRPALARIAAA